MGLDTSHNCWHGSYGTFRRWREAVAAVIGIDLNKMYGFGGLRGWHTLPPDPLHVLLNHSDCGGEIEVKDCLPLAARLEEIAPKLEDEWDRERALQFAKGLREAAEAGEPVDFR